MGSLPVVPIDLMDKTCSKCGQTSEVYKKTPQSGKRHVYSVSTGRSWNGARCPSCVSAYHKSRHSTTTRPATSLPSKRQQLAEAYSRGEIEYDQIHDEINNYVNAILKSRSEIYLAARSIPSIDLQDVIQVGVVEAHQKLQTYDPSRGSQFSTYVFPYVRGRMLDHIRAQSSTSRTRNATMDSIEAMNEQREEQDAASFEVVDEDSDFSNPEPELLDKVCRPCFKKALLKLPDDIQQAVLFRMNGISSHPYATLFGISVTMVSVRIRKGINAINQDLSQNCSRYQLFDPSRF